MSSLLSPTEISPDLLTVVLDCLGLAEALELRCLSRDFLELLGHEQLQRVAAALAPPPAREGPLCEQVRQGLVPVEELVRSALLRPGDVIVPNSHGQTALMWAAGQGSAPLCALFLASGATLENVDSGGWTALFRASWHGRRRAARVLLRAGANVNARAKYTPLMAAARFGHLELVAELLAAGADASLCTSFGETAQSLARDQRHGAVVALLASHTGSSAAGAAPPFFGSCHRRHGVRGRWQAQQDFERAARGGGDGQCATA